VLYEQTTSAKFSDSDTPFLLVQEQATRMEKSMTIIQDSVLIFLKYDIIYFMLFNLITDTKLDIFDIFS